jgi:hypothetical protein
LEEKTIKAAQEKLDVSVDLLEDEDDQAEYRNFVKSVQAMRLLAIDALKETGVTHLLKVSDEKDYTAHPATGKELVAVQNLPEIKKYGDFISGADGTPGFFASAVPPPAGTDDLARLPSSDSRLLSRLRRVPAAASGDAVPRVTFELLRAVSRRSLCASACVASAPAEPTAPLAAGGDWGVAGLYSVGADIARAAVADSAARRLYGGAEPQPVPCAAYAALFQRGSAGDAAERQRAAVFFASGLEFAGAGGAVRAAARSVDPRQLMRFERGSGYLADVAAGSRGALCDSSRLEKLFLSAVGVPAATKEARGFSDGLLRPYEELVCWPLLAGAGGGGAPVSAHLARVVSLCDSYDLLHDRAVSASLANWPVDPRAALGRASRGGPVAVLRALQASTTPSSDADAAAVRCLCGKLAGVLAGPDPASACATACVALIAEHCRAGLLRGLLQSAVGRATLPCVMHDGAASADRCVAEFMGRAFGPGGGAAAQADLDFCAVLSHSSFWVAGMNCRDAAADLNWLHASPVFVAWRDLRARVTALAADARDASAFGARGSAHVGARVGGVLSAAGALGHAVTASCVAKYTVLARDGGLKRAMRAGIPGSAGYTAEAYSAAFFADRKAATARELGAERAHDWLLAPLSGGGARASDVAPPAGCSAEFREAAAALLPLLSAESLHGASAHAMAAAADDIVAQLALDALDVTAPAQRRAL